MITLNEVSEIFLLRNQSESNDYVSRIELQIAISDIKFRLK